MTPRELLKDGHAPLFGKSPDVQWRVAVSYEQQVLVRAARCQHRAALEMRQALKERGERIGEFAARRHLNAEGVRRKLRGETWASLKDLAAFAIERDDSD